MLVNAARGVSLRQQAFGGGILWQEAKVQRRVIGALLMREITARYGRHGLGAGWVVADPLTFAVPVLLLWSAVRAPFEHNLPMMAILWSGYLPILLFRHLGGRMVHAIRNSAGLLYHRSITVLDIFLSKAILEIAENLISALLVYLLFYSLGALQAPADLVLLFVGYFYTIWWCVAVALIVCALSEYSEWVEKIWSPYSYTYIFFGGFGYMAAWLPIWMRKFALLQPSLQAYEMIRGAILGDAVKTYYDFGYDTFALAILTLIGLMALWEVRKRVAVS